jgi:predicted MFS family arabinose efflux permease
VSSTSDPAAPPLEAGRTRVWLVLALWGAGLGAAGQYGKVALVYDMLPALYPGAGAVLGWAVSLVGVVGIVLGVAAGVVISSVGLRRAMLVGLGGGAALSALQALAPPLWTFLALRVAEGAFHLALVVAAPTLISQLSAPRHRPVTLTLWGTFFGVAFAGIAAFGVPLAERHGVPALFLAHAVWMAAFAAVLAALLPADEATEGSRLPRAGELMARSARIYRSARIGAPAAGWLFYTFAFVALLTLIGPYVPEGARTATLTAMPLVSIAASLTLGVALLRWMSAVAVMQIGFASAAALTLAFLAAPGHPALCLAVAAALGLVQGAGFAAVPELNAAPADRALANGGLAQTGNLGNTLGVPVLAAWIAAFGFPGLVWPLALALALGALGQALLARARENRSCQR